MDIETELEQAPVLKVNIQEAGYEQGKAMVRDVRLSVNAGQLIGLIGLTEREKAPPLKRYWGLPTTESAK